MSITSEDYVEFLSLMSLMTTSTAVPSLLYPYFREALMVSAEGSLLPQAQQVSATRGSWLIQPGRLEADLVAMQMLIALHICAGRLQERD